MSESHEPHGEGTGAALDAAIERNADAVRRARGEKPFLRVLGLSLPVTPKDVKQAFRIRARQTHPDHHGDAAEFRRVQEAFDEALAYAEKNGKRLPWLGAQMSQYVAQRAVQESVEAWGGACRMEQLDWLEDTVGEDFALLADRLREIDLTDCDVGDAQISTLLADADALRYLEVLKVAGTRATDASLVRVFRVSGLHHLDVRRTRVSSGLIHRLRKHGSIRTVQADPLWKRWLRWT